MGRDVNTWLSENYRDYLKSVSELSKNDRGEALVKDEHQLYDFDQITAHIFPKNMPESSDGICVCGKRIIFTEFKSGFKKKIRRKNYKNHLMECPYEEGKTCEPYRDLFFDRQNQETDALKTSLYLKGIESYITLTRNIMPECIDDGQPGQHRLLYCGVVDDPVAVGEAIRMDLAGKTQNDNQVLSVKQSLDRLKNNSKKSYYFDELEVFTPMGFKRYLDKYDH